MRRSSELDLLTVASLMPTPDGILLLAAHAGGDQDAQDRAGARETLDDAEMGMTDVAMLVSFATLVVGLLALLPASL